MSLVIRRKAGKEGVSINHGQTIVRVIKVDPDGTVHLSFIAARSVEILREELLDRASGQAPIDYDAGGNR